MSSVDDRIVKMEFRNAQFQKGVQATIDSMNNLNKSLGLDVGKIGSNVSSIASKFSAFGAIGFTALNRLTNGAIDFGKKFIANVTDPIVEGGKKRALNIEQAKFQFRGLGMDVTQSMADALYAVKDTAFGLDEAAVAASQFGASGIKSGDDMQSALRGISGVAAMAGSSYTDMANVFTKVAGQGRLMGDDLNRLGTRGINAASTMAKYYNEIGKGSKKTEADIRDMVSKSQVSFKDFAAAMSGAFGEHATSANKTYAGSLSNMRAALARIGAAFATAKFERQRRIFNALIPVIDRIATALEPMVNLYTRMQSRAAGNMEKLLDSQALKNFTDGLGFFFQGLSNLHRAVQSYLKPVGEAFREVFSRGDKTVTIFTRIGFAFQNFTSKLTASSATASKVRRIFTGFFNIFKIGWDILKGVLGLFGSLLSSIFSGLSGLGKINLSGGFLDMAASAADVVTRFKEWLDEGNKIEKFFSRFRDAVSFAAGIIKDFGIAVGDAFRSLGQGDFSGFWSKIKSSFGELTPIIERLSDPLATLMGYFSDGAAYVSEWFASFQNAATDKISDVFENISDKFKEFRDNLLGFKPELDTSKLREAGLDVGGFQLKIDGLKNAWVGVKDAFVKARDFIIPIAEQIGDAIFVAFRRLSDWFSGQSIQDILTLIATGALILMAKEFRSLGKSVKGMIESFSGIGDAIKDGWGLRDYFGELQKSVKANMILKIAIAVAILAGSMWLLSRLSWEEIGKGLVAMGAIFGALIITLKVLESMDMGKMNTGMFAIAGSILGLGVAMWFMSKAVEKLGAMEWEELGKGVGAVVAMMVALGVLSRFGNMESMTIRAAFAIGLVAGALYLLTIPLEKYAEYKWEEMSDGLKVMAATLFAVAGALYLIPAGSMGSALAIAAVAGALWLLKEVLDDFGEMENKAEAFFTMAGALAAVVGALYFATGTGPGALALLGAAAAVWVLSDALVKLSEADPEAAATALVILALAVGGMVVAGAAATPVAPGILALAAAILAIGIAAVLGGWGLKLAAEGFDIFVDSLINLLPHADAMSDAFDVLSDAAIRNKDAIMPLIGLGTGLIVFGAGLITVGIGGMLAGAGMAAMGVGMMLFSRYGEPATKALREFLDEFSVMKGDYAEMVVAGTSLGLLGAGLLTLGVGAVAAAIGAAAIAIALLAITIAAALFIPVGHLMISPLEKLAGQRKNMDKAADGFIKLGDSAGKATPKLGDFGLELSTLGYSFRGLGEKLREYEKDLLDVNNTTIQVTQTMGNRVKDWSTEMVSDFDKLGVGVEKSSKDVQRAIESLEKDMKRSIDNLVTTVRNGRADVLREINTLIDGITSKLRGSSSSINSASKTVGTNISAGMSAGINSRSGSVISAATSVAWRAVTAARNILREASPSKVMIEVGKFFTEGFRLGIQDDEAGIGRQAESVGMTALDALRKTIQGLDQIVDSEIDVNPVVTPVLDLTDLHRGTKDIAAIFDKQTLNLKDLNLKASSIAADYASTRSLPGEETKQPASTVVDYKQYNYSPEALTTAEIYRQTKNQISTIKEALNL